MEKCVIYPLLITFYMAGIQSGDDDDDDDGDSEEEEDDDDKSIGESLDESCSGGEDKLKGKSGGRKGGKIKK
jgi:hypothetical protein